MCSPFVRVRPARRLALALLASLGGSAALPAQDASRADAAVVDLPAFTITERPDLPPPESWRYARIEGFEILSNAGDGVATKLVRDFQRFHQALIVAWPAADLRSATPAALILCGKEDRFAAYVPSGVAGPDRALVSLSLRDRESSAIVLDLQSKVLDLTTPETTDALIAAWTAAANVDGEEDATVGITSGLPEFLVDHYRQFYREYVRFVLARVEPRAPAWLEEGLSQIFMRMELSPTMIVVGRLEPPGTSTVEDRDFNIALRGRALLPMAELFAVAHDSPTEKQNLGNLWAKQCYAFVHYGLYGENGKHQKAFQTFVARTAREPATEEIFKECFGRTYKQFLGDLRGYVQVTPYKTVQFRAPKGKRLEAPPGPAFREATQAEVGRLKGETLQLAGNRPAARQAFLAPYLRGERDPALLAALGLHELAVGESARARSLLQAATKAKVVRPRAYLEVARFAYADALARPAGPDGGFDADQVTAVLRPLFAARTQPPPLLEVYQLIADTWSRSAVDPTPQNLEVIDEGVRLFVREGEWIYQAAALKARHGMNKDAASLVEIGLQVARDPALRTKFTELKSKLPAPTP